MISSAEQKLNKRYIIMGIALLMIFLFIFIVCVEKLEKNQLEQFDYTIIEYIQSMISNSLTIWMKAITFLGGKAWIVPALLIISVAVSFYKKEYGVYLFLSTGIGALLNVILKEWFQRERPDFHTLITQGGYSFPSGHSMSSFIFYTSLAVVLSKISKRKSIDIVISILFALLVCAIGISRIYLGVHYPSDVLAGFAAGGFWVCLCSLVLNYYEQRTKLHAKNGI